MLEHKENSNKTNANVDQNLTQWPPTATSLHVETYWKQQGVSVDRSRAAPDQSSC
jgi:hypothetical protein